MFKFDLSKNESNSAIGEIFIDPFRSTFFEIEIASKDVYFLFFYEYDAI